MAEPQTDPFVFKNTESTADPFVFKNTESTADPFVFKNIESTADPFAFQESTTSQDIVPYFDEDYANSWTNRFNIATDNMQSSLYKGLNLVADSLNETFPEASGNLKQYALEGIERNLQQISEKPQPTRSASFSERSVDIKSEFGEGDILGGIKESLSLLKDLSAEALPSLGVSGAALLGSFAAAPVIGAVPVVGGTAATLTTLLAPLIPGFLMGGGETYEEAQRQGATPEEAEKLSLVSGGAIGILDRIGAAAALMPFIKSFGKDKVVDTLVKGAVSPKNAKAAVDEAIKLESKEYVKKNILGQALKIGGRAAGIEAATEAGQERTQIGFAGLASDRGFTPDNVDILKRMTDAAAIGAVGGKLSGVTAGTFTAINNNNLAKLSEEQDKTIEQLEKLFKGKENKDQLAQTIREYKKKFEAEPNWRKIIQPVIGRSMTPLQNFGLRSRLGYEIINRYENYFNNVNADIGNFSQEIDNAFQEVRRDVKLPFVMSAIAKSKNKDLYNNLVYKKQSKDERVNQAAEILRKEVLGEVTRNESKITSESIINSLKNDDDVLPEIQEGLRNKTITQQKANQLTALYNNIKQKWKQGLTTLENKLYNPPDFLKTNDGTYSNYEQDQSTLQNELQALEDFQQLQDTITVPLKATGLYNILRQAGIDINFEEEYLPRLYKFNTPFRWRKAKKILAEQIDSKTGKRKGEGWAAQVVDHIRDGEGVDMAPASNLSLNFKPVDKDIRDIEEGFEKGRLINKETFKALDDAGLVENNVKGIIDKYLLQALQRKNLKELKNFVEPRLKELAKNDPSNAATQSEMKRLVDIYQAFQNNYMPIKNKVLRQASRMFLTFQYMLTLPLATLTALTEPFVVLSRVGPKDAIYGLTKATQNTLRQAARTIFPKLKKSEAEQAFNSMLQGYDGTLAERLGSITGVDVARTVTDKFFRTIMLTQITQLSRDIAFQAGRRQIQQDILTLTRNKLSGSKKTKGVLLAEKRLKEQGLIVQNLGLNNNTTIQNSQSVKWAEGNVDAVPPVLIRKALSKFVDETIMAPNVVNRPLWMSNPNLAMFAQLKGFMFAFGNNVGMRIYREVFKPLAKGRIPAGEAAKVAMAFILITAGSIGIRELKDQIRYGDEPSNWKDLEGFEVWRQALISSNIFGPGTVVDQVLNAAEFGSNPFAVAAGPGYQYLNKLISAIGQYTGGNPKALAKIISESIPGISAVFPSKKPVIREGVTEILGGEE
jgi:hypothetical protein